jgi:starch synthase
LTIRVLFLAAEMAPYIKTSGVADVVGALPKALRALGVDARVAIPRYARIDPERLGLRVELDSLEIPLDGSRTTMRVLAGQVAPDLPVYLVDNGALFGREGIYGYPDDGERFILFCRSAMEMLAPLGWRPDVIHCHDWHTGIVPNWLKTLYRDSPTVGGIASIYTIHNLQFQGVFGHRMLEVAGLEAEGFLYHPEVTDLANVVDLMARGIYFSDLVTTVSPSYAREITTPEFGEKLHPLLRDRGDQLVGVLNGIDPNLINPETDPYIARKFGVETLDLRGDNKKALQKEAGLAQDPGVPLIGMVSRLVDHKGLDLIEQVFQSMMDTLPVQFVLMGTGDQHYHTVLSRLTAAYPGRAAAFLTFSTPLSQRIFAGSDIYLMPSRVEPCGLSQFIALRYGGIPVVRRTGGLADTIQDFDPTTGAGNGFSFERYDHGDLFAAIVRAVETWRRPAEWRALQERGMRGDYSWTRSARRYIELYERVRKPARA